MTINVGGGNVDIWLELRSIHRGLENRISIDLYHWRCTGADGGGFGFAIWWCILTWRVCLWWW